MSRVLILLVVHADVIPHDRISSTFWFCFFGKCCRPSSFPGQLEDKAIKSGPGILYCLHFFSTQQHGRSLLSDEVFSLLRVSVVVITETHMEKMLTHCEKSQSWSLPRVVVGNQLHSMLFEVGSAESLLSEEGNAWDEWRTLIQEAPQYETVVLSLKLVGSPQNME